MREIYVNEKNITKYVGDLSWGSDVETLAVQLNFKIAFSEKNNFPSNLVNNGDILKMINENEIKFVGVAIDVDINGRDPRGITCMDFAFYLNENEDVIQFNEALAHEAIKRLLSRFNVKCNVVNIPVAITKIYKGETVSDIIKDILEIAETKTGVKYVMEMKADILTISKQTDLIVSADTKYIINPKRKLSIQNMKNVVKVVSDAENITTISATAEDQNSIKKYGRLQMVHQVNDEELPAAKYTAEQLLKEYNKIFEENEIQLIGNDNLLAGRILKVSEPITGMNGNYLIKNAKHSVSGGVHMTVLSLEVL